MYILSPFFLLLSIKCGVTYCEQASGGCTTCEPFTLSKTFDKRSEIVISLAIIHLSGDVFQRVHSLG